MRDLFWNWLSGKMSEILSYIFRFQTATIENRISYLESFNPNILYIFYITLYVLYSVYIRL